MALSLKDVRESLGISQSELERRASLSRGTVGDIEAERNENPTVAVALAIVEALRRAGAKGVTVESLFGKAA